jgi:predicted acetyltransferase
MNIEITPARDDEIEIVRNFFAFYIHDLSEFGRWDVNEEGCFAVPKGVANYWNGPPIAGSRWRREWQGFPYLVRVDGKLAGFALVKQIADATFDMGEFFVLRRFRRSGVGQFVAHALFDRHPGRWEVREMPLNLPAQGFWRRIIGAYTNNDFVERREQFEVYGAEFIVQRFHSRD